MEDELANLKTRNEMIDFFERIDTTHPKHIVYDLILYFIGTRHGDPQIVTQALGDSTIRDALNHRVSIFRRPENPKSQG